MDKEVCMVTRYFDMIWIEVVIQAYGDTIPPSWVERGAKGGAIMKANRYKMLLTACPFPVECITVASTLKAAVAKARFQNKSIHAKKLLEWEILETIEIKKEGVTL